MKSQLNGNGKEYWRSLNELSRTEEFEEFLHREFPEGASKLSDTISRRKFLSLMGASIAMAGLVSCRKPVEKIVPYVESPEQVVPGNPDYYASSMPLQNSTNGIVVESFEGRPTKVEGNELHPYSLGKSNAFTQAAPLGLYDPDRSGQILQNGTQKAHNQFVTFWRSLYTRYLQTGGDGLAVLSGAFSSPTLSRLRNEFLETFPEVTWAVYEPVSNENIYQGIQQATGELLLPDYHYENAAVVLSLDADFVLLESENVVNAKRFADARRVTSEEDSMNRLYAVESNFTLTGGMADHRMQVRRSRIPEFTVQLWEALRDEGLNLPATAAVGGGETGFDEKWIRELVIDLVANSGQGLVVAGRNQSAEVHALVYAINEALGNNGVTVNYYNADHALTPDLQSFSDLADNLNSGAVDTLLMFGVNPVYDAPADFNFASILENVEHSIHLSLYQDETSLQSEWHIPEAHFLESWGDAAGIDGTPGVIQPMISPLYNGYSVVEILNLMANGEDAGGYEIVRRTWRQMLGESGFERNWRKVVHDGLYLEYSAASLTPQIEEDGILSALQNANASIPDASPENLEVIFHASPSVFDGRFANNGWLQELPDPVTKISWDNAGVMNPATAEALGVESGDIVQLDLDGKTMEIPVWIVPGFTDNTVSLELGFGRESVGRIGNQTGFDVYKVRTSSSMHYGTGAAINKTGVKYNYASTQDHWSLEDRPIYREGTIQEYQENPGFVAEMVEYPEPRSLWEEHSYEQGYQWGMAIDLNVCTGCNACAIACQSENNIPIVGKKQVAEGREMHWIRMDRYFAGDVADPEMVVQPVTCMHCENAPCETVCPVNATMHDDEGLNVQVYNRCIGTRYCSNNCPYKVRRFNFFNYTKDTPEVEKIGKNPDVTVRTRGVMEKCTYCLQRIQRTNIKAKVENREIHTDEVVVACQQTCPTDAIVFGNINDPESIVSRIKDQNRDYKMLAHLNTQPRTSYQAKLRNPNPTLAGHIIETS